MFAAYKILDSWSRVMFNFEFLEKRLGIVSTLNFVDDFSRKKEKCLHYF